MTRYATRFLRAAAFALVAGASAAAPAAADSWGAVAMGPAGAYGWAVNYPNRQAAIDAALQSCEGKCTKYLAFEDGCGSIAMGNDGGGWGAGSSRQEAERNALDACTGETAGCRIRVWGCNAD